MDTSIESGGLTMNIAVVIPAYKPGPRFPAFIGDLAKMDISYIIVVDDGSGPDCDYLFQTIKHLPRVTILRHAVNLGKGAALKTGLNYALAEWPSIIGVVTADADGQHKPEDIIATCKTLSDRPDALILGVRQFDDSVPLRSRVGNVLTRNLLRILVGQNLTDTQTGLRGVPAHLIPSLLKLLSNGYEFELDMLMVCKHQSYAIVQQPIQTIYFSDNQSSHFNPLLDSMRVYFVLFRFTLTSIITALIDNIIFTVVFLLTASIGSAQIVARLIAIIFNYAAARGVVFLSHEKHRIVLPKYLTLVLISGLASYGLIQLLLSMFSIPVITAKIFAEVFLFFVNFAIQRDLIFTRRRGKKAIATDWNRYYKQVPPTAKLTRRYTSSVLLDAIRRYAGDIFGNNGILVEIGGANSCFIENIQQYIHPREYHVIDSNRYGLDLLRRKLGDDPSVFVYLQDVLNLSVGLQADVVFSVGLVEHFNKEDTRRAVEAHLHLVKPGGIAIISFPTPTWLYRAARWCCEQMRLWAFPDERPLARDEIVHAIGRDAEILFEKTLWPLVFTQHLIVARKISTGDRASVTALTTDTAS